MDESERKRKEETSKSIPPISTIKQLQLSSIPLTNPFSSIRLVVSDPLFCHVLVHSIWQSGCTGAGLVNDSVMASALHLVDVALTLDKVNQSIGSFGSVAASYSVWVDPIGTNKTTLLALLIHVIMIMMCRW